MPEQTLAKVYEERAEDCTRAAEGTDDPVFRRLLLMLAAQWKLAAHEEAKSKDTSSTSTQSTPQESDTGQTVVNLDGRLSYNGRSNLTEALLK